jgi:hypothetical protein
MDREVYEYMLYGGVAREGDARLNRRYRKQGGNGKHGYNQDEHRAEIVKPYTKPSMNRDLSFVIGRIKGNDRPGL